MGLDLSPDAVAALEVRTEGWIAGLQLAALSMRDRKDMPGFVRAFSGSHRDVLDFLAEEVLERQPEGVKWALAVNRNITASAHEADTCQVKRGRRPTRPDL